MGYHYVMYICRLRLYTVYMISVEQSKVAQVSLSAEGVAASPSGESITFPRPIPGSVKVDKSKWSNLKPQQTSKNHSKFHPKDHNLVCKLIFNQHFPLVILLSKSDQLELEIGSKSVPSCTMGTASNIRNPSVTVSCGWRRGCETMWSYLSFWKSKIKKSYVRDLFKNKTSAFSQWSGKAMLRSHEFGAEFIPCLKSFPHKVKLSAWWRILISTNQARMLKRIIITYYGYTVLL